MRKKKDFSSSSFHTGDVIRAKCPFCTGDFASHKYLRKHCLKFHKDQYLPRQPNGNTTVKKIEPIDSTVTVNQDSTSSF